MTFTEAITWLSQLSAGIEWEVDMHYAEAIDMAIEALRTQARCSESPSNSEPKTAKNGSVTRINGEKPHDRTTDDLISRREAIDALEKVAEFFPWRVPGNRDSCDRYNEAWNDAIGRAEIEIEELPSAELKNTDCVYCHEDSDGYITPLEKNGHAFIHFGMNGWCLELSAKGWHGETKINYCPMCGRRLER